MKKYKTSNTLVTNVKAVLERRAIQFEIVEEAKKKFVLTELNGKEFHKVVVRAKMEKLKIERGLSENYPDYIAMSEVSDLVVMKEIERKNGNQAYSIVDAPDDYYDYPESRDIEKKEPFETKEMKLEKIYAERKGILKANSNLKGREQIQKLFKLSKEAAEIEFDLLEDYFWTKELHKEGETEEKKDQIDEGYLKLIRAYLNEGEKDFLAELGKFISKYL